MSRQQSASGGLTDIVVNKAGYVIVGPTFNLKREH